MTSLTTSLKLIADARTPYTGSPDVLRLIVGGHSYKTPASTLLGPAAAGSKLAKIAMAQYQAQPLSTNRALTVADNCPEGLQMDHADVDDWGTILGDNGNSPPGSVHKTRDPATAAVADFSNRNGVLFAHVLDYLANEGHLAPPTDFSTCQQLLKEAEYYCLPGLVDLLKKHMVALSKAEPGDACRAKQETPNAHQKPRKLQKVEQGMLELRQLQQRLQEQLRQQRTMHQGIHSKLQQQRAVVAEVKQDISYLRSAGA